MFFEIGSDSLGMGFFEAGWKSIHTHNAGRVIQPVPFRYPPFAACLVEQDERARVSSVGTGCVGAGSEPAPTRITQVILLWTERGIVTAGTEGGGGASPWRRLEACAPATTASTCRR